jgi:hypothetical protein
MHWIVTAFRRYEVTLDFKCKFGVRLTHGEARTEGLSISFPKYMALVMVRDLPAEWHIWVSLPKMEIATGGATWLKLGHVTAVVRWGPKEKMPEAVVKNLPKVVPSVCRLMGCKISSLALDMRPGRAEALLPLVTQILPALTWPELRYFFGEWGYMPRPMAYVIDSMEISKMEVSLSSKAEEANVTISVGPIEIDTAGKAIYISPTWEPSWALNIQVGETQVLHQVDSMRRTLISFVSVGLGVSRWQDGDKSVLAWAVDVAPSRMTLYLSPDLPECAVTLGLGYWESCKAHLPALIENASMVAVAFLKLVSPDMTLPRWVGPFAVAVSFGADDPIEIMVNSAVCACLKIKCSLDLALTLDTRFNKEKPLVAMALDPGVVCIEYLDSWGGGQWEPLLEPWAFSVIVQLFGPPEVSLTFRLGPAVAEFKEVSGSKPSLRMLSDRGPSKLPKGPLLLNVTPALLELGRTLAPAWLRPIVALVNGKIDDLKVPGLNMTALNLAPEQISAQGRSLKTTLTAVTTKLQSIFRGQKGRKKAENKAKALDSKFAVVSPKSKTPTRSKAVNSPEKVTQPEALLREIRFLAPGKVQTMPLNVPESDRLLLALGAIPSTYRPMDRSSLVAEAEVSAEPANAVPTSPSGFSVESHEKERPPSKASMLCRCFGGGGGGKKRGRRCEGLKNAGPSTHDPLSLPDSGKGGDK